MSTIFVSSTFKDMQYERDALQELVLPALNEQAAKYEQSISFCDLRWGINTAEMDSEQGSKKVLDICLDEIDRCNPPMIVILGQRYGWIPSENLIMDVAEKKKLLLDHLQKSVTAMEVEYGAMSETGANRPTIFYFREIGGDIPAQYAFEDEEHLRLVEELKDRIRRLPNARIRPYTLRWNEDGMDGIDDFARMVTADLLELLVPGWEAGAKLSAYQRECAVHWNFIREKAQLFSARRQIAESYLAAIEKEHLLIIKGMSGVGKSTLFSYLASQMNDAGYSVLPFSSGLTSESSTATGILKNMIRGLEAELGLEHPEEQDADKEGGRGSDIRELKRSFNELCVECRVQKKRVVLMVDAVDQLFPDEVSEGLMFIPKELSESVKFVMTCTADFPTGGRAFAQLPLVDEEETMLIMDGLMKASGKELSRSVLQAVLQKKAARTPLYLSFLFQRLTMMNREDFLRIEQYGSGMDAITAHQIDLIRSCPDSLEDMAAQLLHLAGSRVNEKLIHRCLAYLAFSKHGLRLHDIQQIQSDFHALDFSHFILFMKDCFILRQDGRYDFSHKSIRNGLQAYYAGREREIREKLYEYLRGLAPSDILRRSELSYHCVLADRKGDFAAYICECIKSNDDDTLQYAAKNLYEISRADSGAWVLALLEGQEYVSRRLLSFLNYEFQGAFGQSDEDERLWVCVSKSLYQSAERLHEREPSQDSRLALWFSLRSYGNTLYNRHKKEDYRSALTFYNRCLDTVRLMVETDPTPTNRWRLALSYEDVAQTYPKAAEDIDPETGESRGPAIRSYVEQMYARALELYIQLLEESDTVANCRRLCTCYCNMADYYLSLSETEYDRDEIQELSLRYYTQALQVAERALEKKESIPMLKRVSALYRDLAEAYQQFSGAENRATALQYCEKRLAVLKKILDREYTCSNSRDLAYGLEATANAILEVRGANYILRAIDHYEQALKIRKNVAAELKSRKARTAYAIYLRETGNALILSSRVQDMTRALELYRESLKQLEELRTEERAWRESFARTANRLGDAARKLSVLGPFAQRRDFAAEAQRYHMLAEQELDAMGFREKAMSYAETLDILAAMERKYSELIPRSTMVVLEDLALRSHRGYVNPEVPLKEQKLTRGALALLACFNLRHWQDSANRRQELRNTYADNERKKRQEGHEGTET